MITLYKFISVYFIFSFTIGTMYYIKPLHPLAIVLSVLTGIALIIKPTRQRLINIYNKYLLPNIWILFGVFGPLHFYLSVNNNDALRITCMLLAITSGLMELNYRIKSGDYRKWEI